MSMRNGCKNKDPFLQMRGMRKDGRFMTRPFLSMIQRIVKRLLTFGYRNWIRTENKKCVSEKGKEQSIFGRRYQFLQMIGTIDQRLKFGEHPGLSIATDILIRIIKSITEAMSDRG